MKFLLITDPATHPSFDATYDIYRYLSNDSRVELFHISPNEILESGNCKFKFIKNVKNYEQFLNLENLNTVEFQITDFDLIFSRADKPLPINYFEKLSRFEDKVKFVNKPSSIEVTTRNEFTYSIASKYMPDFIISRDVKEIEEFFLTHGVVIAKKKYELWWKRCF